MKKLIILFMIVYSFAEIKGLEELLIMVIPEIVQKEKIKIYTFPKYYIYFKNKKFVLVKDCNKSDIIFGNFKCDNKPIFALNYNFYKKNKNAFGVFYYRKGRPQLKLKKEALERFFKKIPKDLKDFVY